MCGICGFVQPQRKADQSDLRRMNDRIVHRGPDDDGFHYTGEVGLAARRLSIIDLKTGHQPLSSASGQCWITYNGEVYNFPQLRREMESAGVRFRTGTDTEVLVNLYEQRGFDFVDQLVGMFAIGIHDARKHRLVLARDRLGIKPLYYYHDTAGGNLIFGSEIKSILEYPGMPRRLDHEALDYFLSLEYVPAPLSIFRDIRKLPAGHILVWENGCIRIQRYWDVATTDNGRPRFTDERDRFIALLEDAVRCRLISDVPLGAFLSGGIDSSAIVAMMSRHTQEPVQTFSIGFEEKSYSELPWSRKVAETFDTRHYTRNLSPDINELVLRLADFMDEPLGDFSNFPTYLVSRTARERVTVVLSGDGGDEIFGGYEHYIAQRMARFLDPLPMRPFHGVLAGLTHLFPPSTRKKGMINRIKRFSEGLENPWDQRHFRWMLFLSPRSKAGLYAPEFLQPHFLEPLTRREPFAAHFRQASRFSGINQDLYLDLKTYLTDNILVKVDRMSMANSLEARVPLLDHRLVELAFSLPPEWKVRGSVTKWFFKQSMEGILPRSVIHRRKEGFSIPIKNWLRTDLRDLMQDTLSEARIKDSGLFQPQAVQRMVNEHLSGKQNHSHRLWALIQFNLWRELWLTSPCRG
ncbi:MAG TPA: asparagine synthase (glutamine-hydrolyzing) [Candidatus Aminicenantes bacterium]|nr:asparagine synthase (glutamine-hydrolyzing) [Candidatus Aminicenantes bacterium]